MHTWIKEAKEAEEKKAAVEKQLKINAEVKALIDKHGFQEVIAGVQEEALERYTDYFPCRNYERRYAQRHWFEYYSRALAALQTIFWKDDFTS